MSVDVSREQGRTAAIQAYYAEYDDQAKMEDISDAKSYAEHYAEHAGPRVPLLAMVKTFRAQQILGREGRDKSRCLSLGSLGIHHSYPMLGSLRFSD